MASFRVWCLLLGTNSVFSVKITPEEYVDDLKKTIKAEKGGTLGGVDADQLNLWLLKSPVDIKNASAFHDLSQDLAQLAKLLDYPAEKVSAAWFEDTPVEYITVIIENPHADSKKRKAEDQPGDTEPLAKLLRPHVTAKVVNAFNSFWKQKQHTPMTLPTANQLSNFVTGVSLPKEARWPITSSLYEALLEQSEHNLQCSKEVLDDVFQIREGEARNLSLDAPIFSILDLETPSEDGTEASFIFFWDTHIRRILKVVIRSGKDIRDSNFRTDTAALRPDFGFILKKVCVFRGEEKGPGSRDLPKQELVDKLDWDFYPAPYILGYHAVGLELGLSAICPPQTPNGRPNIIDIAFINLRDREDRLIALKYLLKLALLMEPIASMVPRGAIADFVPLMRNGKEIVALGTNIAKTFTTPDGVRHVEKLKNIYTALDANRVPNVDHLVSSSGDRVYLSPKGRCVKPKNELELLQAVRCILDALVVMHGMKKPIYHRDIRWDNVIQDIGKPEKWFLIDFDDAVNPPTKKVKKKHFDEKTHCPNVFRDNHKGEVDVWAVGQLITDMDHCLLDLSEVVRQFGSDLQTKNPPSAAEALRRLDELVLESE